MSVKAAQTGAEAPKKVIDFQPDALEIQNKPLPGIIRFGVWFPLIIVIGAIIWATLARTDKVVQGSGKIVTNLNPITVKPLDRYVIKEILVKIGDVVTNGQPVITFDPEIYQAEADRLQNEIAALRPQLERLKAEFNDRAYVAADEHFAKWQQAIFDQRQRYYREKINYFDQTLKQLAVSRKSKLASKDKKAVLLEKERDIERRYKELKEGAVPVIDMMQVEMQVVNIQDSFDQLEMDILELDERRGSLAAEKESFIQDWRNKISEEMVNIDRNLTSTLKQYDKQKQMLEYVCLRAPCNAIVQQVAEVSTGTGVREAEALMTLIPIDGDKELEAEIRPEDIGHVKVGAEARIKLTAYPFQKFGTLKGVVKNISEDTLDRQVAGMQMKYYRVRLTISGKLRPVKDDLRLKDFRLIPGMESQCEIKCGRRRVIEYVLYPLIKAMDETAREP